VRHLAVLAGLALSACSGSNAPEAPAPGAAATQPVAAAEKYAKLKTNFGEIVIEFRPDLAPKTVENFIALAKKGFYDGLTFHRVVQGFMMQGGCPKGDGSGGPGHTVKAEFSAEKHVAGTVAMARTSDPNSAGSQFYICFAPAEFLDGQYTIFARVAKGMEVVRAVEKVGAPRDPGRPRMKVVMEKVTVHTEMP